MSAEATLHVVGAAIFDDHGRCLITQRAADMSHPLLWEFPGGKIEPGETPQQALRREVHEELGLLTTIGDFVARGEAALEDGRRVVLDVYRARITQGTLLLREHARAAWVHPRHFDDHDWPEADLPAVAALARHDDADDT